MPALDGLRGAAVAAVLCFHGGFGWAKGGFLGVTIFFVLSGFLITGLLLKERDDSGTIHLRGFWARRARRLVPAVLGLVAVVIVASALASTRPPAGLVGDAAASLAWVANWRFVFAHRSYGALFGPASPFQHLWSLAVEEQFYLVFPLVAVALLGRRRSGGRRWALGAVVVAGVVASTIAAARFHPAGSGAGRAYYGTDTRAAEPLIGVLLALVWMKGGTVRSVGRWTRLVLSALGAAGLVGLVLLVTRLSEQGDTLYRGGFLAAALLSAVVIAAAACPGTLLSRLFALPPLVGLGRISYGVYLFHWPVFLWLTSRRTGFSGSHLFAVRCAATLGLALLSYVLVEQPIRTGALKGALGLVAWADVSVGLLGGIVAVATIAAPATSSVLSAMAAPAAAAPAPPPPVTVPAHPAVAPAAAQAAAGKATPTTVARVAGVAKQPSAPVVAAKPAPTAKSGSGAAPVLEGNHPPSSASPPPTSTSTSGPPALKVAVVGDSMANDLALGLKDWAKAQGDVAVYDLSIPGCPISRGGTRRLPDGTMVPVESDCGWWAQPSSDRWTKLVQFAPDVIVVQDGLNELLDRKLPQWQTYLHPGEPQFDSWLVNEYSTAVKTLQTSGQGANGAKVLFLNAVCADWETMGGPWTGYEDNSDGDTRVASLDNTDATVAANNASMVDYQSHLCPKMKYSSTVDGVANGRPDGYHLSTDAGDAVAQRWLGPLIRQGAKPATGL